MADLRDQGSQSSFSDQVETLPELVHYKNMQMQIPSSPTSNTTTLSIDNEKICRICLDEGTETLVAPCKCSGSAKFAHESCLLQWFFKTRRRKCELCLSEVNVKSMGFKPLKKWRLPTDSCDFVFYLFSLYCVIMFVFTGMIIWIATQGCVSPVCITLYVICSMSLVYFIYCCGCVEYSKAYWKACLTTNKNWRIYNREESARSKIRVAKVVSVSSDSDAAKGVPDLHCVVTDITLPGPNTGSESVEIPNPNDVCACFSLQDRATMTGSTTIMNTRHVTEVICSQPCPVLTSSKPNSPGCSALSLARAGSVSLLVGIPYSPQSAPHHPSLSPTAVGQSPVCELKPKLISKNASALKDGGQHKDGSRFKDGSKLKDGTHPQNFTAPPRDHLTVLEGESAAQESISQMTSNNLSNRGYNDTRL